MISPKKSYIANLPSAATLRKEYKTRFQDIYVNKSITKTGLGDTDEEDAILGLGKFIPGKIYTYEYDPLYKDVLSYYDKRPIILVNEVYKAKNGNDIVRGINLNFLPEEIRVATLQQFFKTFEGEITKSEEAAFKGTIFQGVGKIISFFRDWVQVLSMFGSSAGVGYQFAYRSYIIDRIKNLRYVEYQHWEMIPFLNPEEITGAGVSQIYLEYWKVQGALVKPPKKK
jgi:hypothetical protein